MSESGMDLQQRLAYLEGENRHRMQALEMIRNLSDFQVSVNKLKDPGAIFKTCREQAGRLIEVKATAFYLVDEASGEFLLADCHPMSFRASIASDLEQFINDATFSRAVMEKTPVTASTPDFGAHYLFHVLTTVSRVRGMFVAVLSGSARQVPEAVFELLSILMTHCANALESYTLYHHLELANDTLAEKVEALSRSQVSLTREVAAHKKTLGALKESEAMYRLLAETAQEIIVIVSLAGRISYINSSGLALGGYDGTPPEKIWDIFTGFDMAKVSEDDFFDRSHRVSMVNGQGERIPVEISLAWVCHAGRQEQVLIVGRDISARIRAEKEKSELRAKLWQASKMESIGLLAGGTAHDFNNLLTVICNYTDMAMQTLPKEDPAHRYLKQVEQASIDAIALARQLYTIGHGDVHDTGRVDLGAIIPNTLKLLDASLGKDLHLSWDIGLTPLFVLAEETRIRRVLMNLVTNAASAMEGMDKKIIIVGADRYEIEAAPAQLALGLAPGRFIRIWIQDTGPGIPREVLPYIFDPYFSTKTCKENAGLGLSIVHGIIKNYKGAIDVESSPGAGTCFYIYLPEAL